MITSLPSVAPPSVHGKAVKSEGKVQSFHTDKDQP